MNDLIQNKSGFFGQFGGCFIPEVLRPAIVKISQAFEKFLVSHALQAELDGLLRTYAGRETPMYKCTNLSTLCGGVKIYAKREDLLHGGAHKTNNVLGQALLAGIYGARELICETGAGQHGVAVAMVGAKFGLKVRVFMGAKDVERQSQNVARMRIFGAEVVAVETGSKSLKDAINEAMRYWTANQDLAYYIFGTAAGPDPFPRIIAYFHRCIGVEARRQILEAEGRLPEAVVACVGGGSNALGIFSGFWDDKSVRLIGAEPAGDGHLKHGQTLAKGRVGCLHGSISKLMADEYGQVLESHSVSAGLDYPGVSPIHAYLADIGRAEYMGATDAEAVEAFHIFAKTEGIIPALESSHAIALAIKLSKGFKKDEIVLFNLSGRGDKDINTVVNYEQNK
jgi:tryptophan synthase beta chain